MINIPVYHVCMTRTALNELMTHLSNAGIAEVTVNNEGEISFDVGNSGVNIQELNLVGELFLESEAIEKKQSKLKEGGKRWLELEEEKIICINSAVKVMKLLQKHYDNAIID